VLFHTHSRDDNDATSLSARTVSRGVVYAATGLRPAMRLLRRKRETRSLLEIFIKRGSGNDTSNAEKIVR
jgi:hypothetical protein